MKPIVKIPASSLQQQFFFTHEYFDTHEFLNSPLAYRITGPLDQDYLEKSVNAVIARHDILRTVFLYEGGTLYQEILPEYTINIETIDVQDVGKKPIETIVQQQILSETQTKIDLRSKPPFRCIVFRISHNETVLLFAMHHIISDYETFKLLSTELSAFYNSYIQRVSNPLSPPAGQYSSYSSWHHDWLESTHFDKMLTYWKNECNTSVDTEYLKPDRPRPDLKAFKGGVSHLTLSRDSTEKVHQFSKEHSVNEYVTMLTAFSALLSIIKRETSITIGAPFTNRRQENTSEIMGCFANMLPLTIQTHGDESMSDLLKMVRGTLLKAHRNQEIPLSSVVNAVNPERDKRRNPLFQIAFTFRSPVQMALEGCETIGIEASNCLSNLDLYCVWGFYDGLLKARLEYNTALFDITTINDLSEKYRELIRIVVENPAIKLSDIRLPGTAPRVKKESEQEKTLAFASTFTVEPITQAMQFWLDKLNLRARMSFATINQVFQQLLDKSSQFSTNKNGLNIVVMRCIDFLPMANGSPTVHNITDDDINVIRQELQTFMNTLESVLPYSSVPWLIVLSHVSFLKERHSGINILEDEVKHRLEQSNAVHCITSSDIAGFYSLIDYSDPVTEKQAQIPYSPDYYSLLATMVAREIFSSTFPLFKVIVLDCDNTIWSGIVVEDGISGILIDDGRREFQQWVVNQYNKGILICLSSKNHEDDVVEAFNIHPDMPLKLEHITLMKINWNPKSMNIREIAEELNLGLDSFVFFDDNPVECADVSSHHPEILTFQMPVNSAEIHSFLAGIWAFDRLTASDEDKKRSTWYKENIERNQFSEKLTSYADFIQGLNLDIVCSEATAENLQRVSQLSHRTNQFNTTTMRMNVQEVTDFHKNKQYDIFVITVKDRFGDYGLVGCMLCKRDESAYSVESMMLSCRVLGRGVEHEMLSFVGKKAVEFGLANCNIMFYNSARNQPVFDFLNSIEQIIKIKIDGGWNYRIFSSDLSKLAFQAELYERQSADSDKQVKIETVKPSLSSEIRNTLLKEIHSSLSDTDKINNSMRSYFNKDDDIRKVKAVRQLSSQSKLEHDMQDIWEAVLKSGSAGADENFFDAGGDSFAIPQIISQFNEKTGIMLEIEDIFQYPTIQGLAAYIENKNVSRPPAEKKSVMDRAQKRKEFLQKKRRR